MKMVYLKPMQKVYHVSAVSMLAESPQGTEEVTEGQSFGNGAKEVRQENSTTEWGNGW